ncbi:MAG: hypothetical protein ACKVJK_06950 [Methylophagaceae bacterium]
MIIGFKGSFRVGEIEETNSSFYEFPKHKDFKLYDFNVKGGDLIGLDNNTDAYITTGVKGVYKGFKEQYDFIKQTRKPHLVLEGATFRRGLTLGTPSYQYRVSEGCYTWNKGYFANKGVGPDRWNKIQQEQGIEIKPWRNKGSYILVCLQNPTDTSLNDIYTEEHYKNLVKYTEGDGIKWNYINYLHKIIREISTYTREDIKIRLHPRFLDKYGDISKEGAFFGSFNQGVKNKIIYSTNYEDYSETNGGSGFQKDLDGARVVVSYSSNALVEAVCEGIPTVALSETSHAYPVSFHSLDILGEENLSQLLDSYTDRQQWLNECAYTQWTVDEINSGEVHKMLLKWQ